MKKTTGKAATPRRRPVATKSAKAKSGRAATKNILSAGIKALSNVREEAIARQSRVFETLLGIGPKTDAPRESAPLKANPLTAALDPFGFRKFEDVFDQRVAHALDNLGAPTAEAFAALTAEVERLRATVAALEARGKKR